MEINSPLPRKMAGQNRVKLLHMHGYAHSGGGGRF